MNSLTLFDIIADNVIWEPTCNHCGELVPSRENLGDREIVIRCWLNSNNQMVMICYHPSCWYSDMSLLNQLTGTIEP